MIENPTVLLICGINSCPKVVGEIRSSTNGEVLALMHNRFGDRRVAYTPRNTEQSLGFPPGTVIRDARTGETLAEREDRRLRELDEETLRYIDNETERVAKRYDAGSKLRTLDLLGHIVCPEHGICDIPDPDALEIDLRAFVANTTRGSKRRYLMFRGNDLK